MIQGGVVTGRIRDAAGEPVPALNVELVRLGYSPDGRKTVEIYDTEQTDDRGEYRFFWTAPGRYLVRVARNRYRNGPRTFVSNRPVSLTYYPGVLDTSQATAVEVLAGTEIGGIDIVLPAPSGHRLRGRVVDASTGKPPKFANIGLRSRSGAFLEYNEYSETEYNPLTGVFEIRNVSPGSYWLSASVQSDFDAPLSEGALANVRTGVDVFETVFAARASVQMAIDMPPSDLNDVVLTLKQGVAIPVQIAVDGQPFAIEKGLDSVRVAITPPGDDFLGGRQSTRPSAEGITRIDNVLPGEYRVSIGFDKAKEFYSKDVRYGRTDALNDPIQVTEQTPSAITVLLSSKGGQIEGVLRDALLRPVSGVEVILIPDRRDNRELYKKVRTDHDGRFLFRSLSPGGYKVFSWEALEPNAYYDAEVLTQYEALGKSVSVRESEKETIEVKLIPLRTR